MIQHTKLYTIILWIPFLILFAAGCGGDTDGSGEGVDYSGMSDQEIVQNAVFQDLDGNPVSVEDFEGKLLLIDFWESWCGPCLQVFPAMQDLREEYPDEFEVLAVTVGLSEGPEDARAFAEEHDYDFHFLYDANGIFEALGGQGIPFKAYVDPEGNVIKIEMGSYGREGDYNRTKAMIVEHFEQ